VSVYLCDRVAYANRRECEQKKARERSKESEREEEKMAVLKRERNGV